MALPAWVHQRHWEISSHRYHTDPRTRILSCARENQTPIQTPQGCDVTTLVLALKRTVCLLFTTLVIRTWNPHVGLASINLRPLATPPPAIEGQTRSSQTAATQHHLDNSRSSLVYPRYSCRVPGNKGCSGKEADPSQQRYQRYSGRGIIGQRKYRHAHTPGSRTPGHLTAETKFPGTR